MAMEGAYDVASHFNIFGQNTALNSHRAVRNDIRTAENTLTPTDSFTNSMAVTSTNIFVYANGCIVGMVQSLTVNESRQVNKVNALGWEGVVCATPGNYQGGTLSVQRMALYEGSIWNALGLTTNGQSYNEVGTKIFNKTTTAPSAGDDWDQYTVTSHVSSANPSSTGLTFKTLKDQRVPLEIQVKTRLDGSADEFITETYVDCWLNNYSSTIGIGSITVTESASLDYADVY